MRLSSFPGPLFAAVLSLATITLSVSTAPAQESPKPWLRLDPLPGEMALSPRESFDGVPVRFLMLTDGSVYVGGRRDVLRGSLDKTEAQALATRLTDARKSFGKTPIPSTLSAGDGPAIFRLTVFGDAPLQVVILGNLPDPPEPISPLPDFVRRLAGFRHPSLRPFDPAEFAMIVKEKTLTGGCRSSHGLPPPSESLSAETVVPESTTRGFPTGADMAQVCDGTRRYTVVFRPLLPGER